MNKTTDISINITSHREGYLIYRTLRAVTECIDNLLAYDKNVSIEVNISLDNCDDLTHEVVKSYNFKNIKNKNIYLVSYGDLAESRNNLARQSNGKYISFMDGDDLFSSNYLRESYLLAEKDNNVKTIYSVDYIIIFGDQDCIAKRPNVSEGKLSSLDMFTSDNPVNSCIFAHNDVFRDELYEPVVRGSGYGFEDWHFHTKLYMKGYTFRVVPDTILFYRRDYNPSTSLLMGQVSQKAILRGTPLFEPENFVNVYRSLNNDRIEDDSVHDEKVKNSVRQRVLNVTKKLPLTVSDYVISQYSVNKLLVKRIIQKVSLNNSQIKNGVIKKERSIEQLLKDKLNASGIERINSEEMLKQWRLSNLIEPAIEPSLWKIDNINIDRFPISVNKTELYYCLSKESLRLKADDKTCIVMAPWVTKGGADLIMVNTLKTLYEKGYSIILITTESGNVQWLSRVNKIVKSYINVSEFKTKLTNDELIDILCRYIINLKPKLFIGMHGYIEHQIAMYYNKQISSNTKVYIHRFSLPKILDGIQIESPKNFYSKICENGNVTVVTDCKSTIDRYVQMYGYGAEVFRQLDMPIKEHGEMRMSLSKPKKRILFAGRIAQDKLIEQIIEVGNLLGERGVCVDIYGAIEQGKEDFYKELFISNKVEYKGSFDSFDDIPVGEYDAMLFASISEGMPNIILEGIGANLYIVSSNVGGIGEVINKDNGYLVEDPLNPEEYVEGILDYYDNRHNEKYFNRMLKYNKKLIKTRSMSRMKKSIEKIYNL